MLAVALTGWRPTLPSRRTSPEAPNPFRQEISELREAHKDGAPVQVRISEVEVNCAAQNYDDQARCGLCWPPLGSVFYVTGDRGGFHTPAHFGDLVLST